MSKRQHAVKGSGAISTRSPAGDAFSAFAIGVIRLGSLLSSLGDELAKPSGQTSARWQVLAAVEDGPATVARIARMLNLTRQSVQRVADLVAADGLAAYEENPDDLRADLLKLTARGRSTLGAIQVVQRAWADRVGAEIGEARLRRAAEVVSAVMEAVTPKSP